MLKVGITGNYFSGLDEVAYTCDKHYIPVFEADLILRYLFYNNTETIIKIKNNFTKSVFTNNKLDLNNFNDVNSFLSLLKVVEVDLLRAYESWRKMHKKQPFTLFKSQVLFEAGWNDWMNFNISVYRPDGIRINEIKHYFKMKTTDVHKMVETEMNSLQKNRLSNYTIHNYDGYYETVEHQINSIRRNILTKTGENV